MLGLRTQEFDFIEELLWLLLILIYLFSSIGDKTCLERILLWNRLLLTWSVILKSLYRRSISAFSKHTITLIKLDLYTLLSPSTTIISALIILTALLRMQIKGVSTMRGWKFSRGVKGSPVWVLELVLLLRPWRVFVQVEMHQSLSWILV